MRLAVKVVLLLNFHRRNVIYSHGLNIHEAICCFLGEGEERNEMDLRVEFMDCTHALDWINLEIALPNLFITDGRARVRFIESQIDYHAWEQMLAILIPFYGSCGFNVLPDIY